VRRGWRTAQPYLRHAEAKQGYKRGHKGYVGARKKEDKELVSGSAEVRREISEGSTGTHVHKKGPLSLSLSLSRKKYQVHCWNEMRAPSV
jgi:hypothetical protein